MESAVIQVALGVGGLGGTMLLVWFITQQQLKTTIKTITDQSKDQIEAMNRNYESQLKAITGQYGRMMDFQRDANQKNWELLERMLDLAQMQISQLSRIETKIENNQFCPMARKGGV